jgi:hypothetical protein
LILQIGIPKIQILIPCIALFFAINLFAGKRTDLPSRFKSAIMGHRWRSIGLKAAALQRGRNHRVGIQVQMKASDEMFITTCRLHREQGAAGARAL